MFETAPRKRPPSQSAVEEVGVGVEFTVGGFIWEDF